MLSSSAFTYVEGTSECGGQEMVVKCLSSFHPRPSRENLLLDSLDCTSAGVSTKGWAVRLWSVSSDAISFLLS